MASSDELRDSFASVDSPWELGLKIIMSPEASEASAVNEANKTSVVNEANEAGEVNEAIKRPFPLGRLVVEVPNLLDEPLNDILEANIEQGLPSDIIKIKPEEFIVDEAEVR